MAAERLSSAGIEVHVFDAMPSPGRKFLRAGIGGLNLTHAEDMANFETRFNTPEVSRWLSAFGPNEVRRWAAALGIDTFVGSSGRVFPKGLKAAPLLRAWLHRLRGQGVRFHMHHRWQGFSANHSAHELIHVFSTPQGEAQIRAQAAVLAMGGGSWARLGSNGAWRETLVTLGIPCTPFSAMNCGFDVPWTQQLLSQHAGAPLKSVALRLESPGSDAPLFHRKGEALISRHGIQGGLIYAASRDIQTLLHAHGEAILWWDLFPDRSVSELEEMLRFPRGKLSMGNWLRKRVGLTGARLSLVFELNTPIPESPLQIARSLKRLPMKVTSARPVDEAISTGGGVTLESVDAQLGVRSQPGLFVAGEMLDWDAPTGGYLLTACLASGVIAGKGAAAYLQGNSPHAGG